MLAKVLAHAFIKAQQIIGFRRWQAGALLLIPSLASAHSFGRLYNLPVPLWMYLYGAAAALLASFVVLAFFAGSPSPSYQPEVTRGRQSAASITHVVPCPPSALARLARQLLPVLKGLSVLILLLCIVTGLWGTRNPYMNFNMTCFWIVFILLFTYLTALIGDVFRFISPWRVLTDLLPLRRRQGCWQYPENWSYWPALLLYIGFISIELFGKTTPQSLSWLLLGYSTFNLIGVWLIGQQAWFRYVEFFGVFLRLIALMAPIYWQQGRLHWRVPFSGLFGHQAESYSLVLFILFMLSSTAFDGLHSTLAWVNIFWADTFNVLTPLLGNRPVYFYVELRPWYTVFDLFSLCLSPLVYASAFWLFAAMAKYLTGTTLPARVLLQRWVFSVLPIALVYHLTHYFTLILTDGVRIVSLLSDPFGWGWDLFGTIAVLRAPLLLDMSWIWHTQVGLIVFGHIVSVFVAHRDALALFATSRQATISQVPMLSLMLLLTASGLWILAQPISGN